MLTSEKHNFQFMHMSTRHGHHSQFVHDVLTYECSMNMTIKETYEAVSSCIMPRHGSQEDDCAIKLLRTPAYVTCLG